MKTWWISVCLFASVLLSGFQLIAQPAPATPASRDKSLTGERTDARAPSPADGIVIPPPQPVCAGDNYQTNAFLNNVLMGGPIVGIEWVATGNLTINRIEIFTGESTGAIALALYSNDTSNPPDRPLSNLGNTAYFNIVTANSWQGANLVTPVTVTAGTKYWVVYDPVGGEQAPVQNGVGQTYWGASAGTITNATGWNNGPYSFPDRAWKFRFFCTQTKQDVYAVKFLCGSYLPKPNATGALEEGPVKPGNYLTAINVHNPNNTLVAFRKKAVLLYRADKLTEPEQPMPPGKLRDARLESDWGLEIDCRDIRNVLLSNMAPPAPVFIKGWVVIEVGTTSANMTESLPIDVTAVYTSHGWDVTGKTPVGFSEDVEPVRPTRISP